MRTTTLSVMSRAKAALFTVVMLLLGVSAVQAQNDIKLTALSGSRMDTGEGIPCMFDGKDGTKWGESSSDDLYAIFKASEALVPTNYVLTTGSDAEQWTGRNWSNWKIYAANFENDEDAIRTSDKWVLIDEQSGISEVELPDKNCIEVQFTSTELPTEKYQYFMIEVISNQGANWTQMAEFRFGKIVKPVVDITFTELTCSAGEFTGNEHAGKLIDGNKYNKWGSGSLPAWLVFKASQAYTPTWYALVTGGDSQAYTGRNWKKWDIYGGNFANDAAATNDAEGWVLLDSRDNVGTDVLPDRNNYQVLFDFNQGVTGEYQYYKVVVTSINGANYMQMSEMTLCTPEQFPDYVKPIADEYAEYDLNQAAYKGYLDAYTNLLPGLASVTSVAQLDAAKAQLDKAKEQIAASVTAYREYANLVGNLRNHFENHTCITGEGRTVVGNYLNSNEAPSATYANGTYAYIMENLSLDNDAIAKENAFVQQLFETYAADAAEGAFETGYIFLEGTDGFGEAENPDKLIDGNDDTKWCLNPGAGVVPYVIFKADAGPIAPTYYRLFTGNDTGGNPGRNWKDYKIYGGNFASDEAAAKDAEGWVLIDDKQNIGPDQIPAADKTECYLYLSNPSDTPFEYYKIEITAAVSGTLLQMGEFSFSNAANLIVQRRDMYLEYSEFDYSDLTVQQSLIDEYTENVAKIPTLGSEPEMKALRKKLDGLVEKILASGDAYQSYKELVEEFIEVYLEDLKEIDASMVGYFTEDVEPGDRYVNGSYQNIMKKHEFSETQLKEEMRVIEDLQRVINEGGFIVLTGNTGWSDNENWGKLVDGDEKTKWGGTLNPEVGAYSIFKATENLQPFFYSLLTGGDTQTYNGRNWKTWKLYGGNFETNGQATRDAEGWELIDSRENVGRDRLPAENLYWAYFGFTEGALQKSYRYFRVEVSAAYSGDGIQMTELKLGTEDEFNDIRAEYAQSAADFFVDDIVACQTLLDEYEAAVGQVQGSADMEALFDNYKAAIALQDGITKSASVYDEYVAAQDLVKLYLEENELDDSEALVKLTDYLDGSVEPGDVFPNGSFTIVMDEHVLNDSAVYAEIDFMNALLEEAVVAGYVAGVEITKMLKNPSFAEGWTGWDSNLNDDEGKPLFGYSFGTNDEVGMSAAENVHHRMDISQTLTGLKNGLYEVRMNAGYRPNGDIYSTNYAAQLYANENSVYVMGVSEDASLMETSWQGEIADKPIVDALSNDTTSWVIWGVKGSANAFAHGRYENSIVVNVTDGTLKLGIKDPGTSDTANEWTGFGNTRLFYLGELGTSQSVEGIDRALACDTARAQTLLTWEPDYQAETYKKTPNYAMADREALEKAISDVEAATTAQEKYELVKTFTEIFNRIYVTKPAYVTLFEADMKVMDKWGSNQAMTPEQMDKFLDDLGLLEDGLYDGSYTAEQALAKKDEFLAMYPGYLAYDNTKAKSSNVTVTEIDAEPFSYEIQVSGRNPYFALSGLYEALAEDETVLTFEYSAAAPVQAGTLYYVAGSFDAERKDVFEDLTASDDWKKVYVDISTAREAYKWGDNTANWLRWYVNNGTAQTMKARHFLVITKAQMEAEGGSFITGIEGINAPTQLQQSGIYSLTGVRVEKPVRGLYIINGRKVLVK